MKNYNSKKEDLEEEDQRQDERNVIPTRPGKGLTSYGSLPSVSEKSWRLRLEKRIQTDTHRALPRLGRLRLKKT